MNISMYSIVFILIVVGSRDQHRPKKRRQIVDPGGRKGSMIRL